VQDNIKLRKYQEEMKVNLCAQLGVAQFASFWPHDHIMKYNKT